MIEPRKQIAADHPAIGQGFRLLDDHELLEPTDETACVSTLLSLAGERWVSIQQWGEDLGKPVSQALARDADARERLFRRQITAERGHSPEPPHTQGRDAGIVQRGESPLRP